MKKYTYPAFLSIASLAAVPLAAFAQAPSTMNVNYFVEFLNQIEAIITTAIPILYALALLLFVWGVINYFILGAGDEGKRETGRSYMLYAIIGLVAITAVWGIVNLVSTILGVNGGSTPTGPDIPGA